MKPTLLFTIAALVWTLAARPAHAQDVAAAAKAYSEAQAAELSGDHARAAQFYELANNIAPTPEALRSAARMHFAAGHLAHAASLAEDLLRRYPGDEASRAVAGELLAELTPQLSRIEVTCEPACVVAADNVALGTEPRRVHIVYVRPGKRELSASFGPGRVVRRAKRLARGGSIEMDFEAPPPPESVEPARAAKHPEPDWVDAEPPAATAKRSAPRKRGLSRGWVALGAVTTVGLGAATVWSGMDVLSEHDVYEQNPTDAGYDDGLRRERRTNILIGATAAAGVVTVALAFMTDWSGGKSSKERRAVSVTPVADGAVVGYGGSF